MAASSFPWQQRSFFSISVAIWSAVYLYNAYGTTYFQAALRLTVKRNRGRVNVSRRYWMYEDIICTILRIGYTLDLVRVCCEPAYWWKRKLNAGSEQRSHRYRPGPFDAVSCRITLTFCCLFLAIVNQIKSNMTSTMADRPQPKVTTCWNVINNGK